MGRFRSAASWTTLGDTANSPSLYIPACAYGYDTRLKQTETSVQHIVIHVAFLPSDLNLVLRNNKKAVTVSKTQVTLVFSWYDVTTALQCKKETLTQHLKAEQFMTSNVSTTQVTPVYSRYDVTNCFAMQKGNINLTLEVKEVCDVRSWIDQCLSKLSSPGYFGEMLENLPLE